MARNTNVRGIAVWPHLNRPDTKFKEEGEFHTKLRITEEVATPLLERLEELQLAEKEEVERKRKGKRAKLNDLPIVPELDEDTGEETGYYILKTSTRASGKNKQGEHYTKVLPIFDGRGKPIKSGVYVRGGSTIIVCVEPKAWSNPKFEVGVKLYLKAVQVIKLAASEAYGFGAVADAEDIDYEDEAQESTAAQDQEAEASNDDDDYDFE